MRLIVTYQPVGGDAEYHQQEFYGVPEDIFEEVQSDFANWKNGGSNANQAKSYTYQRTDDRKGGFSLDFPLVASIQGFERSS